MKKIVLTLLSILVNLLFLNTAQAELNLTLTQGISGAVPIAVAQFGHDDNHLSDIIRNDLNNSGRFKTLNSTQMPNGDQPIGDSKEVNFEQWKSLKQNDLVVGDISSQDFNHYRIHFQLLDIYKGNPPILDQTILVPKSALRQGAHRISDQIFQSLTGTKGIFSTKIAYVLAGGNSRDSMRYTLEIADYDGSNPKPILSSPQPIMSPAWSKDGKKIAYVSFENNHSQIFISTIVTGARRVVTNYPGINGAPAWSPNDAQLALVLSKTGNTKIYLMDLSSGNLKQMTSGNAIDTEPAFSPDGRSLLFTSDRGGSPQIYRIMLGSQQVNRMTFNGSYNARASFSPDGSQLVMIHSGEDANGYNIGLQDLQSSAYLILDNSGNDQSPSFAPNGQMVVFATKTGPHRQLAIVSTDGRIKLRLPSNEGDVQEPAWSPFLN